MGTRSGRAPAFGEGRHHGGHRKIAFRRFVSGGLFSGPTKGWSGIEAVFPARASREIRQDNRVGFGMMERGRAGTRTQAGYGERIALRAACAIRDSRIAGHPSTVRMGPKLCFWQESSSEIRQDNQVGFDTMERGRAEPELRRVTANGALSELLVRYVIHV
jgi:hypothetical protein